MKVACIILESSCVADALLEFPTYIKHIYTAFIDEEPLEKALYDDQAFA